MTERLKVRKVNNGILYVVSDENVLGRLRDEARFMASVPTVGAMVQQETFLSTEEMMFVGQIGQYVSTIYLTGSDEQYWKSREQSRRDFCFDDNLGFLTFGGDGGTDVTDSNGLLWQVKTRYKGWAKNSYRSLRLYANNPKPINYLCAAVYGQIPDYTTNCTDSRYAGYWQPYWRLNMYRPVGVVIGGWCHGDDLELSTSGRNRYEMSIFHMQPPIDPVGSRILNPVDLNWTPGKERQAFMQKHNNLFAVPYNPQAILMDEPKRIG